MDGPLQNNAAVISACLVSVIRYSRKFEKTYLNNSHLVAAQLNADENRTEKKDLIKKLIIMLWILIHLKCKTRVVIVLWICIYLECKTREVDYVCTSNYKKKSIPSDSVTDFLNFHRYIKQYPKCPDPVNSVFSGASNLGVVSEALDSLIDSYYEDIYSKQMMQMQKLTKKQVATTVHMKALTSMVDPGEAVGALCAQVN